MESSPDVWRHFLICGGVFLTGRRAYLDVCASTWVIPMHEKQSTVREVEMVEMIQPGRAREGEMVDFIPPGRTQKIETSVNGGEAHQANHVILFEVAAFFVLI